MAKGIMKPVAAKAKAAAQAVKAKQVDDTKAAAQAAKPTTPKLSRAEQAMAARQAKQSAPKSSVLSGLSALRKFEADPANKNEVAKRASVASNMMGRAAPQPQQSDSIEKIRAAYEAGAGKGGTGRPTFAGGEIGPPPAPPNQDRLQALQGMLKGLPQGQTPPPPRMPMGGMGPPSRMPMGGMSPRPTMGGRLGAAGGAPAMGGMGPRPPMGMRQGQLAAAVPQMMRGMGMKKGGAVKAFAKGGKVSSASSRGDGIAQRGKTKGKLV